VKFPPPIRAYALGQQTLVVRVHAHSQQPQQLEQQLEAVLHWRFPQDWSYLDDAAGTLDGGSLILVTACDYPKWAELQVEGCCRDRTAASDPGQVRSCHLAQEEEHYWVRQRSSRC
jgi:hypothetical protein